MKGADLLCRSFSCCIGFAIACASAGARAEGGDTALAESLFRDGKRWFEQGDYARACPQLAESYRLDPATGALLALAMCHEAEGKMASAWAEYADVATRSRRELRPDREKAARERAEWLEPQLPKLIVLVPDATTRSPSFELRRDGILLGPGGWATPIAVDPGVHTLEAQAAGKKRWTATITWSAAPETKTITVPPLEDEPSSPLLSAERGSSLSPMRTGALIAGGFGVVATVIGAFFGVRAIHRNDRSSGCSAANCTTEDHQRRLDARADGNISTVAFVAAGALLGGGVTLWVFGQPEASDRQATSGRRGNEIAVGVRGQF